MLHLLLAFLPVACKSSTPVTGEEVVADTSPSIPAGCPEGAFPEPPATWTQAGSLPGGDVRYFASSPNVPDVVWAGSTLGGLLLSKDDGASWEFLHLEASSHAEADPWPDPEVPGAVVYSAGDLWRVDDNHNATALNLGGPYPDTRIHGVVGVPPGVLWAIAPSSVVYRSDDRGETWTAVSTVATPPPFETVEDAEAARALDATYWALRATNEGVLLAGNHGGAVYRSLDGLSWEATLEGPLMATAFVVSSEEVWAAVGATVYHSADAAATWAALGTLSAEVMALDVLPDARLAIATATTLQIGVDGSAVPLGVTEVMGLGVTPSGAILVGHHEGILRSDDGGATFQDSGAGLESDDPVALGIHPSCPGLLVTGTRCTRGLFRSTDGGLTNLHDSETFAHYVMVVATTPLAPERYVATADRSVWVSEDYGESWENRSPAPLHLHGLAIDPEDPDVFLVGSVGSGEDADSFGTVYRTNDAGATWQQAYGIDAAEGSVHAIAFWPGVPGLLLAGTNSGGQFHTEGDGMGLFRSEDGGYNWESVPSLPSLSIPMVRICDPTAWVLGADGLYRSDDLGSSWTPVIAGEWQSLACHGERVVVAGTSTILRSSDGGENWESWEEGAPYLSSGKDGAEIAFTADGELLYLAQATNGLWYRGW